ncbi:MAG TPA: hypothetical protein DCW29_19155 [Janthinobacterium sp.]|nr:hypothetical protein [Janthinobacterium sp.]
MTAKRLRLAVLLEGEQKARANSGMRTRCPLDGATAGMPPSKALTPAPRLPCRVGGMNSRRSPTRTRLFTPRDPLERHSFVPDLSAGRLVRPLRSERDFLA